MIPANAQKPAIGRLARMELLTKMEAEVTSFCSHKYYIMLIFEKQFPKKIIVTIHCRDYYNAITYFPN